MKHPIILTLALLWVFSLTADLNYNYAYMLPHIDSNDSLILFDTFPLPGETENSLYGVFYNDTQQEFHVAGYDEDAISVQYTVPNTVGNTVTHAKVTGDPSDPLLVCYGEGLAEETLNLAVYSLATGAFLDSVNIAIQMNDEFGYILAADLEAAVYDGNITILAGTETSASYYSPSMEEQYYNFTEMLFYQFENQQLVYQTVIHGLGNYSTPVPELGVVLTTGFEYNSYDQGCSRTRSASSISLSNYEIVHTYFSYRGSQCCGFSTHYPSSLWTTIGGSVDFSNYPYFHSSLLVRDEFPNDEYIISKTHNVVTGETVSRDSMFMAPQVGLPKPMEIIYNEAWCYLVQQGTELSVVDTDSLQTIETIPIPQGCIGLYKIPDEYRLGIHEQTNGYDVYEISTDGPSYFIPEGAGTESDPYQIRTPEHLAWISSHSESWSSWFVQIDDFNASHSAAGSTAGGLSPIGNTATPFGGHYNGQGHTIEGLCIDRNAEYQGLFGNMLGAEVSNLTLTDADIEGADHTGGLAGKALNAHIENCYVSGAVQGDNFTGGLVGHIEQSTVTGCCCEAQIDGAFYVGGAVGYSTSSTVTNCYAAGAVNSAVCTGGFMGYSNFSTVEDCYSSGQVTSSGSGTALGGFIGLVSGGQIADCFWDIESSGKSSSAGGTGCTTAGMQNIDTFLNAGWDFIGETANGNDDIWTIAPGFCDGRPCLAWQSSAPAPSPEPFIAVVGGTIAITWDAVPGATGYRVYSSTSLSEGFTEDLTGSYADVSWSAPASAERRYYYVTALFE